MIKVLSCHADHAWSGNGRLEAHVSLMATSYRANFL
jgi:hypothetical protein